MKRLVNKDDFPTTKAYAYLNAANVGLMPVSAAKIMTDWYMDVAINGSNNFNDLAEDTAFDGLRKQGARLFNCQPDDIAALDCQCSQCHCRP